MNVLPKVYLIGSTSVDLNSLTEYLKDTNQLEFLESWQQAKEEGLSDIECLISFYAKLCYKSLVLGQNKNVTKIRDISNNIQSIINTGHGSVLEHVYLNFVVTNCSRIFTHELVRHRVGTAFSQTSGRYVSIDKLDLIIDPILQPVESEIKDLQIDLEQRLQLLRKKLIDDTGVTDFATKKKITSAIRRLAPNGQSNEIGFSCNIRAVRHLIELRTSRHAEWEIRLIFNQIADIVYKKWPLLLYGGKIEAVDGMNEWTSLSV